MITTSPLGPALAGPPPSYPLLDHLPATHQMQLQLLLDQIRDALGGEHAALCEDLWISPSVSRRAQHLCEAAVRDADRESAWSEAKIALRDVVGQYRAGAAWDTLWYAALSILAHDLEPTAARECFEPWAENLELCRWLAHAPAEQVEIVRGLREEWGEDVAALISTASTILQLEYAR